jgi:hypothetical protein
VPTSEVTEHHDLKRTCAAVPQAVISLFSALQFQDSPPNGLAKSGSLSHAPVPSRPLFAFPCGSTDSLEKPSITGLRVTTSKESAFVSPVQKRPSLTVFASATAMELTSRSRRSETIFASHFGDWICSSRPPVFATLTKSSSHTWRPCYDKSGCMGSCPAPQYLKSAGSSLQPLDYPELIGFPVWLVSFSSFPLLPLEFLYTELDTFPPSSSKSASLGRSCCLVFQVSTREKPP